MLSEVGYLECRLKQKPVVSEVEILELPWEVRKASIYTAQGGGSVETDLFCAKGSAIP